MSSRSEYVPYRYDDIDKPPKMADVVFWPKPARRQRPPAKKLHELCGRMIPTRAFKNHVLTCKGRQP